MIKYSLCQREARFAKKQGMEASPEPNLTPCLKTTPLRYSNTPPRVHPFVKWAGGKRTLIPDIEKILPLEFNNYYEPFLGGGSVFFTLHHKIKKAYLSDLNHSLMLTYKMLKQEPLKLIQKLKNYQKNHSKLYYDKLRRKFNNTPDDLNLASIFIYLNKTCFNGLYRVNKSGLFNVPIGRYKNPAICNEKNLKQASLALKKAVLKAQSFERIKPKKKDVVYCDPPYDNTFSSYTKEGFNDESQELLKYHCDQWRKKGAFTIISNSDTPFIRTLYKGYKFISVQMARNINCEAQNRNKTNELLILGY